VSDETRGTLTPEAPPAPTTAVEATAPPPPRFDRRRADRRQPGRVRRWVIRPFVWGLLLILIALAGALFLLQSQYARQQALERIVKQVSFFLGRPIQVRAIEYSFFPPAVELYGVTIPGPRASDPPVAKAPFVRMQINLKDIEGRVVDIEQVEIDQPEVYFQFNPDGTNNLPQFHFAPRGGPRRFDVRIGHILVQNGTFRLNERKLPLAIDAQAIWGRLIGRADRGGEGGNRLDALITAQQIVTTLPRAKPYPFTASVRGSILPDRGQVQIANVRFFAPEVSGRATGFVNYRAENRRVELSINAGGASRLVNRLGYMQQPIEGSAEIHTRVVWTPGSWSYSGTASSPRLATFDRVIQDIDASFLGSPERLDVQVAKSRYAQGNVSGLISVATGDRGAGTPVTLDLDYADLSIHQLIADQFPGEDLPIVGGVSGRARGTFEYRFNSDAPLKGTGRTEAQVRGTSETGLPIAGVIPITLDRGVITGRNVHLTAPGQDITSPGFTYDLDRGTGRFDFRLASQDVGPLGPVLLGPPKRGEEPAFWLPTAGRGTAEGSITFARKQYDLRLRLDLQQVAAPITTADAVHGSLTLNPRAVEDLRLEMTRAGGALMVTGRIPLPAPGRKTASQPIALAIDAAQWPAAGLAWFLGPELTQHFQGQLSGRVDLSGFPERLNGRVDARVEDLVAWDFPLGRARARVIFESGRITVEQGQIEMPAGTVYAQGSFDQASEAMSFTVAGPSLSLTAEPLRRIFGGELAGRLTLEAAANGTLRQPQATVSVRGRDLVLRGRPLGQQGDADAVATWDGRQATVQGSFLGLASFQGGGRLDRQGADLAVDLRTDSLGTLARVLSPRPLPDFNGSLVGTAALGADFSAGTWQAAIRLPDLRLQYQGHAIANREPVVVELGPERATIQSFYMAEPDTENELIASGTVGFAADAPLKLGFQSTLSAAWAGLFLPPDYRVEGALDLLGVVRGTLGNPSLSGEGEIRGGRLIVPAIAQSIEDLNGFVYFTRSEISVQVPRARLGSTGTLAVHGSLILPGPERPFSYSFNAQVDNASVRFPEFLNNRGDANLTLRSSDLGRELEGTVSLDRSLYVEDVPVDLLQLIRRLFQRQPLEQLAETNDFQASTQLAIQIAGEDALRVRNNVADLQGDVRLMVRGTMARPVVFGEVEIDSGGTLVFNDNRYQVERGTLTFTNPNRIDPALDLVATTNIQQFNITLHLSGTLERPDVNFSSDANLADLDIVALIAGEPRPTDEFVAPSPADQQIGGTRVAKEFLYGQAAHEISSRVNTLLRFDRFRINPIPAETGQSLAGVGVTVGKRLSKDIFVTYSTEPGTTRQYVVQVEWQVRKNVVLVLTQAGDGTYAIDTQWQRRF
jgi:translocation-and-assembly-module (TAM) inner membrane subunit TamB-like protein